jgi:hypothetical protein
VIGRVWGRKTETVGMSVRGHRLRVFGDMADTLAARTGLKAAQRGFRCGPPPDPCSLLRSFAGPPTIELCSIGPQGGGIRVAAAPPFAAPAECAERETALAGDFRDTAPSAPRYGTVLFSRCGVESWPVSWDTSGLSAPLLDSETSHDLPRTDQ